jgi:hypothetical protein
VQFFQAFVLRREAAKAGRVDHHHHFARVLTKVLRFFVLQTFSRVLQHGWASRGFAGVCPCCAAPRKTRQEGRVRQKADRVSGLCGFHMFNHALISGKLSMTPQKTIQYQ